MEISTGAATGVLRLGLQVVTTAKRPVLDIYFQLRHIRQPDAEFELGGLFGIPSEKRKVPDSALIMPFFLVNLGTVRAEDVKLSLEGDIQRWGGRKLSERPIFNGVEIPQVPPAQAFPLFILDPDDLVSRGPDNKPNGMKPPFSIKTTYRSGAPWYYRPIHPLRRRGERGRYSSSFRFDPLSLQGADIPPAE